MNLANLLSNKKSTIVKRWFDIAMEPYPADTSGFLKNQKNQFTNPVGYTIFQGLENLFGKLIQEQEMDLEEIASLLDSIIRIRAIQGLTPSQALAFVFHLRKVVREDLESGATVFPEEMLKLESRIDAMALISFDVYMKCREKVYELKANEVRNRTFRLLQMANLVKEE